MNVKLSPLLTLFCVGQIFGQFPNPQPTDAHQVLAQEAGTWDCDVKMFLQGPEGPPSEFKGVEINEMVSNGLYSKTVFKCKMGESEFEGHSLFGYDSRTKEYVGTWIDNFTTVPTNLKGKHDPNLKTLTLFSTVVDGEGKELKQKQVTTYIDKNSKKFEIFLMLEIGKDQQAIKLMEMNCKKRQG